MYTIVLKLSSPWCAWVTHNLHPYLKKKCIQVVERTFSMIFLRRVPRYVAVSSLLSTSPVVFCQFAPICSTCQWVLYRAVFWWGMGDCFILLSVEHISSFLVDWLLRWTKMTSGNIEFWEYHQTVTANESSASHVLLFIMFLSIVVQSCVTIMVKVVNIAWLSNADDLFLSVTIATTHFAATIIVYQSDGGQKISQEAC